MPQGVVRVDLGESGTMEAAIAAVLHENGVYDVFPNEVLEQALAIPQEVDMGTAGKRLDLRDKLIFTIDGDDAKDLTTRFRSKSWKTDTICSAYTSRM